MTIQEAVKFYNECPTMKFKQKGECLTCPIGGDEVKTACYRIFDLNLTLLKKSKTEAFR